MSLHESWITWTLRSTILAAIEFLWEDKLIRWWYPMKPRCSRKKEPFSVSEDKVQLAVFCGKDMAIWEGGVYKKHVRFLTFRWLLSHNAAQLEIGDISINAIQINLSNGLYMAYKAQDSF